MVRPFPLVGGICCATFLLLEAVRSVYFGAMFQQASSFLVGGLVFGVISCAVMSYLWVSDRQQWLQVWKHRGDILRLNVLTALSWGMYFFAVQMIEPAVAYTVFSGVILLTMVVVTSDTDTGDYPLAASLGHAGIVLSLVVLGYTTLAGLSGFVRGNEVVAAGGLLLAVGAAVTIAFAMLSCKRLDALDIKPLTQLGFRFVLYFFIAGVLGMAGVDAKGDLATISLLEIVAVGLFLTAIAGYAVQRAVAELTPVGIGVASAFGPCIVFGLQMLESRVLFTSWTLFGISLYCLSACVVSVAPLFERRPRSLVLSAQDTVFK